MQKFDDSGEANGAAILAFSARIAGGEKQQRRTQPLAASAKQVSGDLGNRWKCRLALPRKFLFDKNQVFPDQIKNLFGRQQSDGMSPKSVLFFKTRSSEARRLGETKETPEVPCCGRGNFFWRTVSHTRKRARYLCNVSGLISFAAARLWRQVRRIRLNQNLFQRQNLRNVANVLGFRIGRISRKRNQESHVNAAPRILNCACKTVQNPAKPGGPPVFIEHVQAIRPGIAAVNDNGELCFFSESQLFPKNLGLHVAR